MNGGTMNGIATRRKINSKLAGLGMRHEDLAKQFGISRKYLSQIINGKAYSKRIIKELSEWSEITINDILDMLNEESK
jgi:transcriptional regulator with XRE-family HTH domain